MIILNQEQEKIAYAKVAGHMGVKGIAGSGKTSCGIARIPFLVENYCMNAEDKVLLLTFNKTLVNYIRSLFEEYSKNKTTLFPLDYSKVEIRTVDQLTHKYYRNACNKQNTPILKTIAEYEANDILKNLIASYMSRYPEVKQINENNLEFIKKEIAWIQNCNYLSESEYQIADRSGLGDPDSDGPQKLAKNSEVRRVLFKIQIDYLKEVKALNKITFEAFRIRALKEVTVSPQEKYKHIIIDEAQDLSKTQLEFIKQIYLESNDSTIMFLYDGAQSIYDQAWIGKKRTFKSVGFDMVGRVRTLTKNFRTTTQISQAAYSLIKNYESITSDEHYSEPKLIDRQGPYPIFKKFDTFQEQIKEIKNLITKDLAKYPKNTIYITARTSEILKEAEIALNSEGIPSAIIDKETVEFDSNTIKLITMHSIKGLESKIVIIISCNDGILPLYLSNDSDSMKEQEIMDKKLLYVGMTRATEQLFLFAHGKESSFINEIDKNFLIANKEMNIRALYNISIDDFLFKNHPRMDVYKSEEKIRQWFLKELIETYKYPIENIELEFPIQMGSSRRFADIVIYRMDNGFKKPFILVEIKKNGSLVESDVKQLESYCAVTKGVEFAVLTDGKTINIYDKNFKTLKDMPEATLFDEEESYKNYKFLALKEGYDCSLAISEYENKLNIIEGDKVRNFISDDLTIVPVIGKISAGIGIDMVEELISEFPLPKIWCTNSFMLKVKGDSMIDAYIDDGDLVLIKKETSPLNGDIVVCTISNEEATLKRFQRKSDQIILIPENREYDRIYLNPEDESIRVIGVLTGIIKNN